MSRLKDRLYQARRSHLRYPVLYRQEVLKRLDRIIEILEPGEGSK
jgi:hypothetical protein